MRLNNNVAALNTYTSLTQMGRKIDKSMRILSSGYKINSVADDAAGTSISNKMKMQIRGLEAANRNSLDGISMIQTADGAFTALNNMVQRIRELAVQASNDTLEPDDRRKSDEEVQQLLQEINATAMKTEFNKIKILNGDASRLTDSNNPLITKTTHVSDDFNISLTKASDASISGLRFTVESVGLPAMVTLDITQSLDTLTLPVDGMVGQNIYINGERLTCEEGDTAEDLVIKFAELIDRIGAKLKTIPDGTGSNKYIIYTEEQGADIHLNISGPVTGDVAQSTGLLSWFGLASSAGENTGADAKLAGDTASYNGIEYDYTIQGNKITFKGNRNDSIGIKLQISDMDDSGAIKLGDGTVAYDGTSAVTLNIYNIIKVEDYGQLKLQIGAFKNNELSIQIRSMDTESLGIKFADIKSWEHAQRTIDLCDRAMEILATEQAKIGSYQNRLELSINSLNATTIATQEALSFILDTDVAWEMTILTQNQMVSQAAMSIMAQANNRPQMLLQAMG